MFLAEFVWTGRSVELQWAEGKKYIYRRIYFQF